MFYYLWAHCVFHLVRWFQRNNRRKIQVVLWLLSLALLAPQFYALFIPESSRYCDRPLLDMLVVSVVFTFIMLGFVVLLSLMDPLPSEVKIAFHLFGLVCLIEGVIHTAFTWTTVNCASSVVILYNWSLALAVLTMASTGVYVILVPFWIVDHFRKNSVLNREEKSGLCYEPVKCCSCVWHV